MQQQPVNPLEQPAMMAYRINNLEQEVQTLKAQFAAYTPTQVNDLRIQSIQDTVHRIEVEVSELKHESKEQSDKLNVWQKTQDTKFSEQQTSLQKIAIRLLWGFVCTVLGIVVMLLGTYLVRVMFP